MREIYTARVDMYCMVKNSKSGKADSFKISCMGSAQLREDKSLCKEDLDLELNMELSRPRESINN